MQVEQTSRCAEVVRSRLERSSAVAQDSLLLVRETGWDRGPMCCRGGTEAQEVVMCVERILAAYLVGGCVRAAARQCNEPSLWPLPIQLQHTTMRCARLYMGNAFDISEFKRVRVRGIQRTN